MRNCLTLLICFILTVRYAHGQKLFQKQYYPVNQTSCSSFIGAAIDNEHLILASCVLDSVTEASPMLFKVNKTTGEVVWAKKYTNTLLNFNVLSIVTLFNKAILISGLYLPNGSLGITRPFAMLTDKDGNMLWCKDFSDLTILPFVKAVFLSDNSIVVGYSSHFAPYNVVLNKFSFSGTPIWQKSIGSHALDISNDQFKDIVSIDNGGFYLLMENDYKTNPIKSGICLFDQFGSISKCINIESVDANDIVPSSLMVTNDQQLMIAIKQQKAISTMKIKDLSTIEWVTNPFARGWSFDDEFILSKHPNNNRTYLIGEDDNADDGYTGLRIVQYDSFSMVKSTFIAKQEHAINNGNGGIIVTEDALYLASTVKARQPNFPVLTLAKINLDIAGCTADGTDIFQAAFSPASITPYPAQATNSTFISTAIVLKQENISLDTLTTCEKDYFDCRKTLDIGPDTFICNDSAYLFKVPYYASYKYFWSTGDTNQTTLVHQTGMYHLTLVPPPGFSCDTLRDSATINFVQVPPLKFTLTENPIWPNIPFQINIDNAIYDTVKWLYRDSSIFEGTQLRYSFPKNGYQTIYIKGYKNSCPVMDSVIIEVKGYSMFMPNIFTPNNDNINDIFKPTGAGIVDYELYIFNNWGQLVYLGKDTGWNGINGNSISPDGSYIYVLKYTTDKQLTLFEKGIVNLIR